MATAATGQASDGDFDRVLVVDFGAQYAQLIARRVREAHVFSEIVPRDITADEVAARAPIGIILSGGPASVYEAGAYGVDKGMFELGIPVLGICYGHQVLANGLGGTVERNDVAEYGPAELTVTTDAVLFSGLPVEQPVWMSHRDSVTEAPPGFVVTASTGDSPVAAMEDSGADSTAFNSTQRWLTRLGARRFSSTSSTRRAAPAQHGRMWGSSSSPSPPFEKKSATTR